MINSYTILSIAASFPPSEVSLRRQLVQGEGHPNLDGPWCPVDLWCSAQAPGWTRTGNDMGKMVDFPIKNGGFSHKKWWMIFWRELSLIYIYILWGKMMKFHCCWF